jgi:hypothetical protein
MENPKKKWMITGGIPHGKPPVVHILLDGQRSFYLNYRGKVSFYFVGGCDKNEYLPNW